jgi:predicted transglutaminase-like cysteine proteinase
MKNKYINTIRIIIKSAKIAIITTMFCGAPASADTVSRLQTNNNLVDSISVQSHQILMQPAVIALAAGELVQFAGNMGISRWLGLSTDSPAVHAQQTEIGRKPVSANFFGSVPVPFSATAMRQKWYRVRASLDGYRDIACGNVIDCDKRVAMIKKLVDSDRKAAFSGKLETVNATINAMIRYTPDMNVKGKIDHWGKPADIISTGEGDCEDYAILKLAVLKDLGVPMDSMSVIVLQDKRRNVYHAVLAVSTNRGHLILDNTRNRVFRDTAFADYKPLYSFSDNHSWIHGTKPAALRASAVSAGNPALPANVDYTIKTASVGSKSNTGIVPVPVQ